MQHKEYTKVIILTPTPWRLSRRLPNPWHPKWHRIRPSEHGTPLTRPRNSTTDRQRSLGYRWPCRTALRIRRRGECIGRRWRKIRRHMRGSLPRGASTWSWSRPRPSRRGTILGRCLERTVRKRLGISVSPRSRGECPSALVQGVDTTNRIDVFLEIGEPTIGAWLERHRVTACSRVKGVDRSEVRVRVHTRSPATGIHDHICAIRVTERLYGSIRTNFLQFARAETDPHEA